MPPRYNPAQKASYFRLRDSGWNRVAAIRELGFPGYDTAIAWDKHRSRANSMVGGPVGGREMAAARRYGSLEGVEPPAPLHPRRDHLCEEAKRGLEDFEFFRLHYFGHVSTPWQIEAAQSIVTWLENPEKEFVVVNCPPGSGKSTLFTHDIPAWLIVRNRGVRIFIGSRTLRTATTYSFRLRNTLARTRPMNPDEEKIKLGLAAEPLGVLALDYGRFKPEHRDLWRREEFVVEQVDTEATAHKESTVTAWGQDSEFLGFRADFIVWDDLVTSQTIRTVDAIEQMRAWWEDEAEARLEPGGVLCLQGQRMGAEDLYRFCLDMAAAEEEDEDGEPIQDLPRKYRHVRYPAHDEEKCQGAHSKTDPAWPQGCLLDPRRVPWKGAGGLATIRKNRESKYRVQYQQEDVDPASVLVRKCWIDGGIDEDGSTAPGCWSDHVIGRIPPGLTPPILSIATADPSPSKYWAIEWWIYHPLTRQRFLVDLVRQAMTAPEFLDWNNALQVHSGVMEEWQTRSRDLGAPISHWVIENNAAQRWLLQYEHVQRWMRHHGTRIIGHNTNVSNKLNEEFGIQSLRGVYRDGLVRLPGGDQSTVAGRESRIASFKLIDEATRYPGATDDCLMAHWFAEYWLPRLVHKRNPAAKKAWRPSWVQRNPRRDELSGVR